MEAAVKATLVLFDIPFSQQDSDVFLIYQASSLKSTMLTKEKSPQIAGVFTATMPETERVDAASWSEADFEKKCTYVVKDHPLENESGNTSQTRAERSLPRNLALQRCPKSAEV